MHTASIPVRAGVRGDSAALLCWREELAPPGAQFPPPEHAGIRVESERWGVRVSGGQENWEKVWK